MGSFPTIDREEFDHAQRRHRRAARLRAIPAVLAAAAMGIPVGVYLSPVLLAAAIIVTDLVNFIVPTADLGGAVWSLLDRLIDGDPGTIAAIALILLFWVIPGVLLLAVLYVLVAWRLRRIGGDGLALGMGARPADPSDPEEVQLVNVVDELAVAAGIETPRVLLYDEGPPNALVFGRDHDHATVVVGRRLLAELDREETQGVIARVIASAVDGDLGLAVDIGAVYVTFGLVTTSLAAIVSRKARVRWRAAVGPIVGRHRDPRTDAAGIAALLGLLAEDDDTPSNAAGGCLSLLTMGGIIGVGVAFINLFLSGPLLTFAWRPRDYLADATAVDLTRDPDGLSRALARIGEGGRGVAGTAWLELLLVVDDGSVGAKVAGAVPRLSDSGLMVSITPPVDKRLARLRAMGAFGSPTEPSTRPAVAGSGARRQRTRRFPLWLGVLVIAPLIALVAVLAVVAVVLIVYLVAIAAFIVLAVVAGPLHDLLRGLARPLTDGG